MNITFEDNDKGNKLKEAYEKLVKKHNIGNITKEEEVKLSIFIANQARTQNVGPEELIHGMDISKRVLTMAASYIRKFDNGYYEAQLEELAARNLINELTKLKTKPETNKEKQKFIQKHYVDVYEKELALDDYNEELVKILLTLPPTEHWDKYVDNNSRDDLQWLKFKTNKQ